MSKFLDFFSNPFGKKSKVREPYVVNSLSLNVVKDAVVPKSNVKILTARVYEALKKLTQGRNYDLLDPDENFITIANAKSVEPYLRRAVDRYIEMIWKNGFEFVSQNDTVAKYIQRRFKEIAFVTEKPTRTLFEEITDQLVTYYNVFILKVRNPKSSSGKAHKLFGKNVQPIAGYFILDCTAISVRIDKDLGVRKVLGYEYVDDRSGTSYEMFFPVEDVIHVNMNKDSLGFYGKPVAKTVLDDIRALRRMEENVEILVFQHTIPLYHYAIGTENQPCETDEITSVQSQVESMMTQGMLITSERHKITAVGVQKEALQVENYLEYFKARILTGLGQSRINLGEGSDASRATADVLGRSGIEAATRFKNVLQVAIEEFMISELLLEGGFDFFDEKNKVEIFIPEIDADAKVRKEFHTMQLYQGGLIDEDEARKDIGRKPFTDLQRVKTYFELITKPRTLMISGDEPWIATYGKNKTAATAASKTAKAGASVVVPENQYGTKKIGATQRTKGDDHMKKITDSVYGSLSEIEIYKSMFNNQYSAALSDIMDSVAEKNFSSSDAALNVSRDIVLEKGSESIISAYKSGFSKLNLDGDSNNNVVLDLDLKLIHKLHAKAVCEFFRTISVKVNDVAQDGSGIVNIFDSHRYVIDFISDWFVKKAFNLAVCTALRIKGQKQIEIVKCENGDCEIEKINIIDFANVPPYSANCECYIKLDQN